jgi:hypothetical protein
LIRDIINNEDSASAYDTALDNAAAGGLGFYQINSRYVSTESFEQEIYIERILDPLKVIFPIHRSKDIDFSDCDYCFLIDDIAIEDFKLDNAVVDPNKGDWSTRLDLPWVRENRLRRAYYWRKVRTPEKIALLADGSVVPEKEVPEGVQVLKTRTVDKVTVEWYLLVAHKILARGVCPGEYLPIIPVIGKEVCVDGKRRFKGVATDAFDAQKMLNYWKSNLAENSALAPISQWMIAEGQDEGYKEEYSKANTSKIVTLHYKPVDYRGQLVPAPSRVAPAMVSPAVVEEIMQAEGDIRTIIGLPDVNMGKSKTERSGKAILANQREGELLNYHFADNLRKGMAHGYKVIASWIPEIYDTERVVKVLGNDQEAKNVPINKPYQDNLGANHLHDLRKLKFETIAETGPSYSSKREQTAEFLMELIQHLPDAGIGLIDLIAKAIGTDEEVIDRCKMLLPPNLQQSSIESKDVPPAVKMVIQQLEQGIQKFDFLVKQKDQMIQQLVAAVNDKSAERDLKLKTAVIRAEAEITKARMTMAHDVGMAHLNVALDAGKPAEDNVSASSTEGK